MKESVLVFAILGVVGMVVVLAEPLAVAAAAGYVVYKITKDN